MPVFRPSRSASRSQSAVRIHAAGDAIRSPARRVRPLERHARRCRSRRRAAAALTGRRPPAAAACSAPDSSASASESFSVPARSRTVDPTSASLSCACPRRRARGPSCCPSGYCSIRWFLPPSATVRNHPTTVRSRFPFALLALRVLCWAVQSLCRERLPPGRLSRCLSRGREIFIRDRACTRSLCRRRAQPTEARSSEPFRRC